MKKTKKAFVPVQKKRNIPDLVIDPGMVMLQKVGPFQITAPIETVREMAKKSDEELRTAGWLEYKSVLEQYK